MRIALIGYGRMGHVIQEIAISRGHDINLIVDIENEKDLNSENLQKVDVAIEFSLPDAAFRNIKTCLEAGIPVVSGTTGWLSDYDRAKEICMKNNTAFIHSTNFSIGVNLLFRLNEELARQMKKYSGYSCSIEEIHHVKKLDAPSGTALSLVNGIVGEHPSYKGWCFKESVTTGMIPVKAVREGMVPGIHTITWDSENDSLSLRHESKNRNGLAFGAVIAAEFIISVKGVYTMNDVLGF